MQKDNTVMGRDRGLGIALAGAAALFALGACGDDADASDDGRDAKGGGSGELTRGDDGSLEGPVTVTFDVTGDVTMSGSATSIRPTDVDLEPISCAEWADGVKHHDGSTRFYAPLNYLDMIDGKTVVSYVHVSKYDGPGTYTVDQLKYDAGGSGFLHIDDVEFVPPYPDADVELVVNDDGSGSYTFDKLDESVTGGATPQNISGSMTWTCEDE